MERLKVNASFFVLGENLETESQRRIVSSAIKSGHYVGSHSYKHIPHTTLQAKEIDNNFSKTEALLNSIRGDRRTPFFLLRLPYGDGWRNAGYKGKIIQNVLRKNSLQHFGWHIDSHDYEVHGNRKDSELKALLHNICDAKGGVILMHDTEKFTAKNLEKWIFAISCAGHKFVDIKPYLQDQYLVIESNAKTKAKKYDRCLNSNDSIRKLLEFVEELINQ